MPKKPTAKSKKTRNSPPKNSKGMVKTLCQLYKVTIPPGYQSFMTTRPETYPKRYVKEIMKGVFALSWRYPKDVPKR